MPTTVDGVYFLAPTDVEVGRATCFGHWDISGHNSNGGLECAPVVSLGSCSFAVCTGTCPV